MDLAGRRILVTGATGFLGRHVVRILRERGSEVLEVSRGRGCDLRDFDAACRTFSSFRPEAVVHCAAHVGGIAYNKMHPVAIFEDNLRMGIGLLRAVRSAGCPLLVNVIPNCVYPGHLDEYEESRLWDGPVHPSVLAYGVSRKMLLGLCECHRIEAGLKSIHLILANLYGPGDHVEDPVRSHALGAILGKVLAAQREGRTEVEIWGTGNPKREWLYVEDAAAGIVRALEREAHFAPGEVCNLARGETISIRDLAEKIREAVGWKGKFVYDPSKPDGAAVKVMSVARMRKRLDWRPAFDLDEGLRRTVAYFSQGVEA